MPRIAFAPSSDAASRIAARLAPAIVDITVEQHAMLRALLGADNGLLDGRQLTELLQIARIGLPGTGMVDLVKAINAHDSIYVTTLPPLPG